MYSVPGPWAARVRELEAALLESNDGAAKLTSRGKTLERALKEIGARCQGSAAASLSTHFRERWLAIQRIADKAIQGVGT
jgi:hypothetical protein